MPDIKLFHFPGACSRVTMTALEHIGCHYEDEMIDLMAGRQREPAYLQTNPRGKVPALLVDGRLLSENGAILLWLDSAFPDAALLPQTEDRWRRAQIVSDLFWVSSVWHPYVRANKMPVRWTTGDVDPVRERGRELLTPCVEQLETRLGEVDWWYGDWSIVDVYFYWCYTTAEEGGFPLEAYANIARHRSAIKGLPAFQRTLVREQAAIARQHENA